MSLALRYVIRALSRYLLLVVSTSCHGQPRYARHTIRYDDAACRLERACSSTRKFTVHGLCFILSHRDSALRRIVNLVCYGRFSMSLLFIVEEEMLSFSPVNIYFDVRLFPLAYYYTSPRYSYTEYVYIYIFKKKSVRIR